MHNTHKTQNGIDILFSQINMFEEMYSMFDQRGRANLGRPGSIILLPVFLV